MSIDARGAGVAGRAHSDGRSWRVLPVALVALLGSAITAADAYLRTDAARALVGDESLPDSPGWVVVALVLAQAAALWWRRRWPVAVFSVAVGIDIVVLALSAGTLSAGTVAVVVTAYSLFRWRSGASVYLVAGVAALASTAAAWFFSEPTAEIPAAWEPLFAALRTALVILLPALIAELVASRSRAMVVLRERAELAERERERSALDAVQRERTLMARELHDIAAHHLTGIIVGAQAAGALVAGEPDRAREYMQTVAKDAQLTLANLRQTVGLLRSDTQGELAPAPAIAQIPELVAALRDGGMTIVEEWEVGEHHNSALGPLAQTAAYRMVQESLANARRHAPGTTCTVRVSSSAAGLEISVANAAPLSAARPARPAGSDGHGLLGMRERAVLVGAELITGRTPDGGWRNTLRLPPPADSDESRTP
jgi:signal transduction histidine kinase